MSEEVNKGLQEGAQPPEMTQAEKTAKVKEERAAYKKYITELEANVVRMRLETEEMRLFLEADHLKKELNKLHIRNAEEQEERRKAAEEAAEKAKKDITVAKVGKARTDEKAKMEVVGADKKG